MRGWRQWLGTSIIIIIIKWRSGINPIPPTGKFIYDYLLTTGILNIYNLLPVLSMSTLPPNMPFWYKM